MGRTGIVAIAAWLLACGAATASREVRVASGPLLASRPDLDVGGDGWPSLDDPATDRRTLAGGE